jgi:hypothetical protein
MVLHGIWQTLTFQFRGKDSPLVTKLSVTGLVFPIPASMYTEITGYLEWLSVMAAVVTILLQYYTLWVYETQKNTFYI